MPAVAISKEQKQSQEVKKLNKKLAELTRETEIALYAAGIPKQAVAAAAGVEPAAISMQIKRGRITMPVYLAAQMLLLEKGKK